MKPRVQIPFITGKTPFFTMTLKTFFFLSSEVLQRVTLSNMQLLYLYLEVCKIFLGPFSQCIHILLKTHSSLQSTDCSPSFTPFTNLVTAYIILLAKSLMQELNNIYPSIVLEENLITGLSESLDVGPANLPSTMQPIHPVCVFMTWL